MGERTEAREILVVDLVSGGVLFRSDNKQKVWLAGGLRFSGERLSWGHGGVNLATGATWFDVPDRSLPIEPPVPEHKGIRLSPYLQWMARGRAAAFESLNTTPVDLEREFSIRDHYVSPVSGTSYAFGTMRYYIGVLVAYEGDTRCVAEYWIVPDGACFALSPDESLLVVGSEKGVVAWDLNASEVVGLWPATDPPISMTFSSVRTIVVRFASGGLSELELLGWTSSHDEREGWK